MGSQDPDEKQESNEPDTQNNKGALPSEDCFVVGSKEELDLNDLSGLAKQILDTIPIQIFIKEPDYTEGKGRQYRYLNKTARDIPGWDEKNPASNYYDGDAFAGGTNSSEWKKVFDGESETLRVQKRVERQLVWTSPTEHGEVWRLNKVTEVPILLGSTKQAVGFCALAEDIEFNAFVGIHKRLRALLSHQYGNVNAQIDSLIDNANTYLELIQASDEAEGFLKEARAQLKHAHQILSIYTDITDALFKAITVNQTEGTIDDLLKELEDIFKEAPWHLNISVDGNNVLSISIKKPEAWMGVLIELIQNAAKYDSRKYKDKEISLCVRLDGDDIIWEVGNMCHELLGRLNFGNDAKEFTQNGFSAMIIKDILQSAFGIVEPNEIIKFPDTPDETGWVRVTVRTRAILN